MNATLFVFTLFAGAVALAFMARDFWSDLMTFIDPKGSLKDEVRRRHGDTEAYQEAATKIDRLSTLRTALIGLTGLGGMLVTAWIIFG